MSIMTFFSACCKILSIVQVEDIICAVFRIRSLALTLVPGSSTMREYLQAFRDEWNKARSFVLKLDDMATVPSVEVAKFCSQNRLALLKAGKKFTKNAPSVNLTISLGDFRGDRLGFDDALTYALHVVPFIARTVLHEFHTISC